MNDSWYNYPLGVFTTAISTSIGGVLVLFLTLGIASAFAYWVPDGDRPDPVMFLVVGLAPICMACLQLWGLLYVLFLVWVLYRLVYQDASRVLTAMLLAPVHFVFSLIVFSVSDDTWLYWDKDLVWRLAIAVLILMVPLPAVVILRRHLMRKQEGIN
jgi:hypothetical protein